MNQLSTMRTAMWLGAVVVIAMAVFGIVAALVGLNAMNPVAAGPSQGDRIKCKGSNTAAAFILHDTTTRVTANPAELADRWADVRSITTRYSQVEQRTLYQSGTRAEIAFTRPDGNAVAVLSFDKHSELGWRLESIRRCAVRQTGEK